MADIYVFPYSNDTIWDYTTMGACGALTPTEAKFEEAANGDSVLTLTHPIDREWGRHNYLVEGAILVTKVPVRTTPEIQNGSLITHAWTYTVAEENVMTSKAQRALYTNATGTSKIGYLEPGSKVTVVLKPNEDVSDSDDNNDRRWKVKSDIGQGWINFNDTVFVEEIDHDNDNNSLDLQAIVSPVTVTPQIFRIYEVEKGIDSVSVTARHISYDLLYNITLFGSEESVTCQQALNGILNSCVNPHDFTAVTDVANEAAGVLYGGKNPIDAFFDQEEGICKKFDVNLVRDNHSLYFLHDPGINRGTKIEYAKNMTGVSFTKSIDEVATRIIPVGEYEDGSTLYLANVGNVDEGDNSTTGGYAKLQNIVLRRDDNNYDRETVGIMKSRLIELGYSEGITATSCLFSEMTEKNLKNWQRDNGFSQTGYYDSSATNANGITMYAALFTDASATVSSELMNITLQWGDRGSNVSEIQKRLIELGYSVGSSGADGIWGDNTSVGFKSWQTANGFTANGIYSSSDSNHTMFDALFGAGSSGWASGIYVDSPNIDAYSTIRTFWLECENCKVGEEEEDGDGSKNKVTIDIARARMRQQAQRLLEQECDKPKIEVSVEFVDLGDTVEYEQFKGLENVFLYDYVEVLHRELDIDVLARVTKITWDVLTDRMESMEIGDAAEEEYGTSGICSWQLPSGINGGKIRTNSMSGTAFQNGTIPYAKFSAASIEALMVDSINAVSAHIISLSAETADITDLTTAIAHIAEANIDFADIVMANIDVATITTAVIENANIDELVANSINANVVSAITANIESLFANETFSNALHSSIADVTNAYMENAQINFLNVGSLTGEQGSFEALFSQDQVSGKVFIEKLAVLEAQIAAATVQDLTVKASNGNYYKLDVTYTEDSDTGAMIPSITPTQVYPTSAEIQAGVDEDGESRIIDTTIPYTDLSVGDFKALHALIMKLNADTINAAHFFANEATIGALSAPLISTAVVNAINGALDFWAGHRISFTLGEINYSASQLLKDTQTMNANSGWYYGTSSNRYQQVGDETYWRMRVNHTGATNDVWVGVHSPVFELPKGWQNQTIVVSADLHSDSFAALDRGITWSLNLTSEVDGTPVRKLYYSRNNIVVPGINKWGTDAANHEANSVISGNFNRVEVLFPLEKSMFSAGTGYDVDDDFDSMTHAYLAFYVKRNGNMVLKKIKAEWGQTASDWSAGPMDQGDLYTQLSMTNDRIYAAVYDSGISSAQMLRKTQQMNLVAGDTTGRYWKNASGSTDVTQPNFITRYSVSNSEQVRMRIRNSTTGWLTAKSPAFPIRDLDVGDILTLSFYGCIYYTSSGATTWNSRMQAVIVPVDESSMGGFVNNSLFPSLGTTHDLIDADRTFGDADMNHVTTDPMPANNVFTRFRTKFTVTSTLKQYSYAAVFIRINGPGDFAFHSPKLERSEVATQWTAHPAELNAGSSVEIDKDGVKIKTSEFSVSLPNGQDTFVFDNKGLSAGQISSQSITGNVVNTYTGAQYVTITTKGDLKNYISNNINGHYLPQKVYLEMRQGFSDTTNLDIFGVSGEALTIQRYRSDTGTKPNISGKITVRSCSAPIIFNNMSLQNSKSTSTGEGVINTYCSFVSVTGCDIMPGSSSTQNGTAIHAYQGSNVNVHNTFFVQARYAALSEEMSNVFFTTCRGLGQVGSLNRTGAIHVSNNNTHMPVPISGQNTWSITNGANVYGASGVVLDDGSGGVVPTPIPSQTSYTASVSANGYRIAQSSSGYDWTSTNVVRQGLFWENGESVKYYGAYEFTVPSSFTGTLASASITLMRRSGGASGNVTVKGYKMNNWTGSGAPSVGALLFSGTAAEGRTTEFTVNIANLGTVSATTPNNKIRIVIVADDSSMPAGASESPNAAVFGGMADGTTFMTLNV